MPSRNAKRLCHICHTPLEKWCHKCSQQFCGTLRKPALEMTSEERLGEALLLLTPPFEIPVFLIKDRVSELLGKSVTMAEIMADSPLVSAL